MRISVWVAFTAAMVFVAPVTAQQVRPDAGTVLETNRQPPPPPPPTGGAAAIVLPPAPEAAPFDRSIQLTPAAFSFEGNTLIGEAELAQAVAPFVGKLTDMGGLIQATNAVRDLYRRRGYILTEAYLPVQSFAASGGTVRIRVIEARVGKVKAVVEGTGISQSLATRIVEKQLPAGAPISEYLLEKPILLLRDLSGYDATAGVSPGAEVGEADVTVTVKSKGPMVWGLVGADNSGPRSAGQFRGYYEANVDNLIGAGDQLSGRVQLTERAGSRLYRVGYNTTIDDGSGTRFGLGFVRSDYALGKQFAALGASGVAEVATASFTEPLVRSRTRNMVASFAVERKELEDQLTTPANIANRRVHAVRGGLQGNYIDDLGVNSYNSYSLNVTHGHLTMDPASLVLDLGAQGAHTNGKFWKVNYDYQRAMFFSATSRLTASVQGQLAWRNLTSAEKFSLGGPTGVRGYPVGEALGDGGFVTSLEYRQQVAQGEPNTPVFASAFYDWGRMKLNQRDIAVPTASTESLGSVGVGLSAGVFGDFLFSAQLAWRTDARRPASDPDRRPRFWFSAQKWL